MRKLPWSDNIAHLLEGEGEGEESQKEEVREGWMEGRGRKGGEGRQEKGERERMKEGRREGGKREREHFMEWPTNGRVCYSSHMWLLNLITPKTVINKKKICPNQYTIKKWFYLRKIFSYDFQWQKQHQKSAGILAARKTL